MDQRRNKKWKYSLVNFVQTFFPSPKIQQNHFGILSLHSLDKFPIFSDDENDEQSCIFVDAITWLKHGLRINWPYLVHFCIKSKLIKRIAFIRPLPFGNRIFRFAFISPIFAFNVFGHSQIELLDGLKIENFSAIELEGIEIEMAKTIQIKLVEGGEEEENGMDPPFLDNNNLAKRDEAIKEFFSTPKLIYDGDLFNVKNWIYEAKFPSSQEGNNEEAEKLPKFVEFGQSNCIELANNNNWQYKFPQKYCQIGHHHYLNRNFIPKSIKKLAKEISLQFLPFFTPKKCIKNGENIQRIQIINPIILLQIESNEGAILAIEELAFSLDVRLTKLNCLMEIWEEGQGEMGKYRQKIEEAIENVAKLGQCICWIQEIGILFGHRGGTMGKDEFDALLGGLLQWIRPKPSSSHSQIIFIITCSSMEREEMPERLKKLIHWEFALEDGGEKLDEKERNNYLWQNIMMKCEMNYEGWDLAIKMAKKTKGMTLFELDGLICEAKKMAFNEGELNGKKPTIRLEHLEEALRKRKCKGKAKKLGVNLADVGGLDEAKMLLKEALAELVKQNDAGGNDWDGQIIRRRSGILLYGPPGCGKTLLAKAVANEFGLAFLSVKGPELLSQYVGESEKNLRELFAKGRKNAPAVLFFDELDSLAPRRGGNTDSGGVMDRMVSQLLTELDNCQFNKEKPIFVMGATNRADLLDPCLLAPGRFEKLVPILPATNLETKEAILGALCKNVKLAPGFSIHEIAQKCPESMSGADLAGLVRSAKMHRIREIIQKLENGQRQQGNENLNEINENDELIISAKHFEMALNERNWI